MCVDSMASCRLLLPCKLSWHMQSDRHNMAFVSGLCTFTYSGRTSVSVSAVSDTRMVHACFIPTCIESHDTILSGLNTSAAHAGLACWILPSQPINLFCLQDEDYESFGAKIVDTKDAFGSDIVLKVRPPKIDPEAGQFKDGARFTIFVATASANSHCITLHHHMRSHCMQQRT